MSVITSGKTFANGEQLSASKLNQVITAATFASGAIDPSVMQIVGDAITVRDGGIVTGKIAPGAVNFSKLTDVLDEDNMSSDSDTSLATQQSIKAYVDGTVSTSENGYMKLPNGVIMQWGTLTPAAQLTDVTLPIAFPNACLNVQSSIGENLSDTVYTDNSLIWGGFPKSGDLSKITIMSNLRLSGSGSVVYKKMFWQAIGH